MVEKNLLTEVSVDRAVHAALCHLDQILRTRQVRCQSCNNKKTNNMTSDFS